MSLTGGVIGQRAGDDTAGPLALRTQPKDTVAVAAICIGN
jgi:hypothetical protein